MGMSLLKCSDITKPGTPPPPPPNPNPGRFVIGGTFIFGPHILAYVTYPDCTTFEGKKLLLFLNTTLQELARATWLDPHFSNQPGLHPVARFEPTERGEQLAFQLIRSL